MEDIAKVLKTIIEKHLLPTIASIAIMLVVVLIIPSENWAILKLGEDWFKLMIFCISFVSIKFVVYLYRKVVETIKKRITKNQTKRADEERDKKKLKENIQNWQDLFDKVSPYEAEIIRDLVKNKNNAITRDYIMGPNLFSGVFGGPGYGPRLGDQYKDNGFICITEYCEDDTGQSKAVFKYKLTEPVYEAAKYIMETKGRLTSFEEVK